MPDREKVFDAFRNCITEPKCKDCPWEQCEQFNQKKVTIPVTLALDVLELLKWQEPKMVKVIKNAYNEEFYFCPNCDKQFYGYFKRPLYCDQCGQAVKWE